MLRHTFLHVPGLGHTTEQKLWSRGIHTWEDAAGLIGGSPDTLDGVARKLKPYLPKTLRALEERDASFFERLGRFGESWRLFSEFRDECVYLDIETTGLSSVADEITVVGTYDGKRFKAFVQGINLGDLASELEKYPVVVTFNGGSFDLPFLRKRFAASLPKAHIDLRSTTHKLGYSGGLKYIEPQFGIKRPRQIASMDGFEAVILWRRYRRGDKAALDRLIEYNEADVTNLKQIMEQCYERLAGQHAGFFAGKQRPATATR
jgi:uncharacterized protein YprB with RNaseH-like and TPR domain